MSISVMEFRRGRLVVLIVFVLQLCLVSANFVFNVQHKFAGRERSLSAYKAHDIRRHGRVLAGVDLPMGGNANPNTAGLYFAKIGLGTPSNDYHVQVDTGSNILWVNCAGCEKCPTKSNLGIQLRPYDPKGSKTAKMIACDQDFCTTALEKVPIAGCRAGARCQYIVTYADGSGTEGFFVQDNLQMNRVSGNLQTTSMNGTIAFGCGSKQSGELGSSSEAVDGILGFGQANSSMISQLASAGKVKKIFAHCLDGKKGGGVFALGEVVQPKIKSTPIVPNQAHYNIIMKAIEVGSDVLQLPKDADIASGRKTVIDSGTTLAYLPQSVFDPLIKKIVARQPKLNFRTVEEQFKCFKYTGKVDDGFPAVTFRFENSLSLKIYPRDYLFQLNGDEWCIGWQNSGSGVKSKNGKELILLGDIVLSNKVFVYDLEKNTIGWAEHN
ncbi:aspartic proteinase 36-like isoform X2 [Cornus florida]|nr:aspartic proteinase 36-like isoform X2 [Cornus florida]